MVALGSSEGRPSVNGFSRMVQNPVADIGADNLDSPVVEALHIEKKHCNRVWLFAGGTPGTPYTQFPIPDFLLARLYFRYNLIRECLELKGFPKEIGFIRGEDIHEVGKFMITAPVVFQKMVIFPETSNPQESKPLAQPFLQQVFRVMIKENPAMGVNEIPYEPEFLI
jgi:hypothetical protein